MEKLFNPGKENRLFNAKGIKIKAKNDGDNFRFHIVNSLIKTLTEKKIDINSILDIGSGRQGGLGKGIADILKVPLKNLCQIDLDADEKLCIKRGNILIGEDLPEHQFGLGLLIQVLRDISNSKDVQTAISNLMRKTRYSVITNVDSGISRVESDLYCDFRWLDKGQGLATISTKFFDGTIREYKPFYIHNGQEIENFIKQSGEIISADPWVINGQTIFNYWITKSR